MNNPANNPINHPQTNPPHASSGALWLGMSGLAFLAFLLLSLLPIMLLNGGWVNYLMHPAIGDFGMFQLIWQNQPLSALQFIATKSFLVFAHKDPQTGLNIWTLEYDAITLGVYVIASVIGAKLLLPLARNAAPAKGMASGLVGCTGLVLAFTYMTSIDHCAGPTWIGFVIAYGLGADNFEHAFIWQGLLAGISLTLLRTSLLTSKRSRQQDH